MYKKGVAPYVLQNDTYGITESGPGTTPKRHSYVLG